MTDIMRKLQETMMQIETGKRIQTAIGNALNQEQQMEISKMIAANKDSFIYWVATDVGRAAVREFANKFIASK
jgi:hypothetical protein